MREYAVEDISENLDEKNSTAKYRVLYDGQCEICQACLSWLKALDHENKTMCVAISLEVLPRVDSRLRMDECLRQLHVVTPEGEILVGWDAVASLARLSPSTWIIGTLGQWFPFRNLGRLLYGFVAKNRYSLSKCRGGACRVAKPEIVRRQARLGAFWSCYTLGFFIRLPLVVWAGIKAAIQRTGIFVRTHHKRLDLLDGKLTILFLNGFLPNTVPLLFGELFTTVLYDGIAIDPGSPKMRRSLARHLRQMKPKIAKVVATHAHEEHVGNLNWLADLTGARIYLSAMTARFLTPFKKLPWVRATIIGQPPNLAKVYHLLGDTLDTDSGYLEVVSAPGHCDDHIVLYDPKEKVLLAGDAFMGSYFATPNPDVDSKKWLVSLERLMELDIEILVEGHGHIHTLRTDIPDFPGVVIRENPKVAISQKLDYLQWLREQIEAGFQEGLPVRAIEASCFPWGQRTAWESCATDECIRLLSLGHFSRTELVRSFVRTDGDQLPTVYECGYREESDNPLFRLIKPSKDDIRRFISKQKDSGFSYPEVGASAATVPKGYNIDHNRAQLGRGEVAWERAVQAIRSWQMFSMPWVKLYLPTASIQAGINVAVSVYHFGFYSLNACRIVYVVDENAPTKRFGFAYGTLAEHAERGEERFTVEWNREDDTVWYDILARSRPQQVLARLGYPLSPSESR